MGTGSRGKINAIWWNIKVNLRKLADICGHELPINLQNIMQKDLTKVKIFQIISGRILFLKHPVHLDTLSIIPSHSSRAWALGHRGKSGPWQPRWYGMVWHYTNVLNNNTKVWLVQSASVLASRITAVTYTVLSAIIVSWHRTQTMPMTMRRSACRCLTGTFCSTLQPVSWSSLNATAKWWFSSTDSSLYINANSDSASTHHISLIQHRLIIVHQCQLRLCIHTSHL